MEQLMKNALAVQGFMLMFMQLFSASDHLSVTLQLALIVCIFSCPWYNRI